jgi:lysophospholipase L1-like esterase
MSEFRREQTPTYLFVGDGLTEGAYGESYVERIAKSLYLGQRGLGGDVANAAVGPETIHSAVQRIDEVLQHYQPSSVVLAVGGNDVWIPWLGSNSLGWWLWHRYQRVAHGLRTTGDLDEFGALYRMLVDKVRSHAGTRVVACTTTPFGERLNTPVNRQLARLNGIIRHVAEERQVPVADIWQVFIEELAPLERPSGHVPREWIVTWFDRFRIRSRSPDNIARRRRLSLTFDGVHLNSRGADLWAATILEALARQA